MKIRELELFTVPPRWLFLKISTDEGFVGWGEPIVEGQAGTVRGAVEDMADFLIGRDPREIEDIWQTLFRARFYRGGPVMMSAIAGVNQALWDIKGKFHGAPIYELLGGKVRDRVQIYAGIGGETPEDVARQAQARKDEGLRAVKMGAVNTVHYMDTFQHIDEAVARVAAVRAQVGDDFSIAVDFHGKAHKPMAKMLIRELEPYHLMFVEEPILPMHNESLLDLKRSTSIPIATGERMYSRWDFKTILAEGSVDIIQPDVSHAGGISEVVRIAAMAEAYDVALAPHCPLGPIALASCIQVDAVAYNALIQEQSLGIHYNEDADLLDYLADPTVFNYEDGFVNVPTAPGLGIELDEDKIRAASDHGLRWRNPITRRADGSIAEW
ncbi:MAG: galactonate dehydratase [Chloroflexota bacterium]|nr:galactonate dehydratase [Chloroflexota bacterium]